MGLFVRQVGSIYGLGREIGENAGQPANVPALHLNTVTQHRNKQSTGDTKQLKQLGFLCAVERKHTVQPTTVH